MRHSRFHFLSLRFIHATRGWLFKLVLKIAVRLLGYSRYTYGKATFWGPKFFIEYARDALRTLSEKDQEKSRHIAQRHWIFWYCAKAQSQVATAFSIDERFCAWKSEGVLAYLIVAEAKYAALGDGLFRSPRSEQEVLEVRSAFKVAYDWLEANGVSATLCDAIKAKAEERQ